MALKNIVAIMLLVPAASFAGVSPPGGALGGIEGSVPATSFFAGASVSPVALGQLATIASFSAGDFQALVSIAQANGTSGALANASTAILSSPAALSDFARLAGVSQAEAIVMLTALGGSDES